GRSRDRFSTAPRAASQLWLGWRSRSACADLAAKPWSRGSRTCCGLFSDEIPARVRDVLSFPEERRPPGGKKSRNRFVAATILAHGQTESAPQARAGCYQYCTPNSFLPSARAVHPPRQRPTRSRESAGCLPLND